MTTSVTIKEDSLKKLLYEAFAHGKNDMALAVFGEWVKKLLGSNGEQVHQTSNSTRVLGNGKEKKK